MCLLQASQEVCENILNNAPLWMLFIYVMSLYCYWQQDQRNMGQVKELWLSCYLVLLSIDSKTR